MGHLYKFNLFQMLREKGDMFWSLVFPLILATLFYVTFGTGSEKMEQMQNISVAVVKEGNLIFESYLQEMNETTLTVQELSEEQALELLKKGEIEGIFYSRQEPTLTVTGSDLNASILETLLTAYLQNQKLMEEIALENPLQVFQTAKEMSEFREMVHSQDTGGKTNNDSLTYFFALIGMTCLFGCFRGMSTAKNLRADQSALASRRSIVPVHRLTLVIGEMLAAFTIQLFCTLLLLVWLCFVLGVPLGSQWLAMLPVCALGSMTGVAFGIFIGCLKLPEGVKECIVIFGSLGMSFLAGLMFGNMKDIVERKAPFLNRINPAALISDAFYSISIYENPTRYWRSLGMLSLLTLLLVLAGYWRLRRERYDSL